MIGLGLSGEKSGNCRVPDVVSQRSLGEDMAMTKETGALVQKLRLQRGLVARAIGRTSVRTIQRIERGQTASLETLNALASVFGSTS